MKTALRACVAVATLPLLAVGVVGMLVALKLDGWLQRPAVDERARRAGL